MRITIPLLINPKAGSLFRSGLKGWLDEHREAFYIIPTKSAEDLTAKARKLAEVGEPIIAVAGGDGTLMNAANGLIGTKSALGILPCGTMNVFAREIGIGSRRFDTALDAMQNGIHQAIDIFTVNKTPFLQMAGFGLDARIVHRITPKLKRHLGAAAHVITALQVAMEHHPMITVTLPGGEELLGTQVIFGNGKRYGGEAHLFAHARYDDGLLETAVIHQESMPILFEILSCMIQRGASDRTTSECTKLRSISSCDISADGKLDYQLDGEYVGTIHPGEYAHIEKLPDPLYVCTPLTPVPVTSIGRLMAHPMIAAWLERIRLAQEL